MGLEPTTIPQTTGYPTIERQDHILSRRWESNPLTDGSRPPVLITLVTSRYLADVTGVEPAPNCVTGRHLNRLTSHPYLSGWLDSNQHDVLLPKQATYQLVHIPYICYSGWTRTTIIWTKTRCPAIRRQSNVCCEDRTRTYIFLIQSQVSCH